MADHTIKQRSYTPERRAEALQILAANGNNLKKTSRETGIPRSTLRLWLNGGQVGNRAPHIPDAAPPPPPPSTPGMPQPAVETQPAANSEATEPMESDLTATGFVPGPDKDAPANWPVVFLAAISRGAHVCHAARTAGVSTCAAYLRRKSDETFAAAWFRIAQIGARELEREACRRAYHGTLRPVFYKGRQVGSIREYSDSLLQFLLRGKMPERYADRVKNEHFGPGGSAIPHEIIIELPPTEIARHALIDGANRQSPPAVTADPGTRTAPANDADLAVASGELLQ